MTHDVIPGSVHLNAAVKLDVCGRTDVGLERTQNQDQFFVATMQRRLEIQDTSLSSASTASASTASATTAWLPPSTEGTLMLVADGMGGTEGGEIASAVAVRSVAEYVCNVMPWVDAKQRAKDLDESVNSTIPGLRTGLHRALVQGDSDVRVAAATVGGGDMGTTVTLAYLLWPQLYVAHVGDSRCYILRRGRLVQLTTDHTLAEKMRQRSAMEIDESSPWHHILWNSLGGGAHASIEPEVHRHALEVGDIVLLCSDGLTKHATDEEIAQTLTAAGSSVEACERLIVRANADGGTDNTTVIVARCVPRLGGGGEDDPTHVKVPAYNLDDEPTVVMRSPKIDPDE
ncbi:MAG: protein phosphatase 2C domain-containing protein [Polyangiaceae bacterium]